MKKKKLSPVSLCGDKYLIHRLFKRTTEPHLITVKPPFADILQTHRHLRIQFTVKPPLAGKL